MADNKHRGTTLGSFLEEEGVLPEFQARAIKEVIAWQLAEAMRDRNLSQNALAKLMHTSRTQVARVLDPNDGKSPSKPCSAPRLSLAGVSSCNSYEAKPKTSHGFFALHSRIGLPKGVEFSRTNKELFLFADVARFAKRWSCGSQSPTDFEPFTPNCS